MIKGENKKGQEGGTWQLLLIILGLAVLIILLLGLFLGFDKIFGFFGLLPDDLTELANACKTYSETEVLRLSYCQFYEKTLEGKKGWYNCIYVRGVVEKTLGQDKVDFPLLSCASNIEEIKCESLKSEKGVSYKGTEIVNGKTCADWGIPKPT